MFTIEFYRTERGECPVEEFMGTLEGKMQQKTLRAISLLKDFGNQLREPFSKPISNGIFELRVKLGTDIVRIMYFFHEGRVIILTNGFVKKTQKTPKKEIVLAERYRDDYIKRRC